jgi:hypothetical protein
MQETDDPIKNLVVAIIERAFLDLHDFFVTMDPKYEFMIQTDSVNGLKREIKNIIKFLEVDGDAEFYLDYFSIKVKRGVMAKRVNEMLKNSNVELCFQKAHESQQRMNKIRKRPGRPKALPTPCIKKEPESEIESSG